MAILIFRPENMKTYRQLRGLNQKGLAERCGLSRPFISQIEKGNRVPSAPAAEDIAKALNVPVYELYQPTGLGWKCPCCNRALDQ